MPKTPINFPNSIGATSFHELENGQIIKLFMVDSKIPLYNMFVGKEIFFADAQQVAMVIDEREENPDSDFVRTTWKWVFDGGFDKSIDGRGAKGWCLSK